MLVDINIATGITGNCKWIKSLIYCIVIMSEITYKFRLRFNGI